MTRVLVTCAAALGACSKPAEEAAAPMVGDAISPKRADMIAELEAAELRQDPPEKASDLPGLKVEIKAEGQGDALHYGMLGKVHYIGSLASGKVFASTYKGDAPKPAIVRVLAGPLPKGLALGLDGCKVGERRVVTVPAALGYGAVDDYSNDLLVPKHSVLVYEVEVVEVLRDLRYKVLTEGSGDALQYRQRAKFHYTGVLASDGTQFDSSAGRDPIEFQLSSDRSNPNPPIAGWVYGLLGMKTGEKRRLRIPAVLGYGETGHAPTIPANADLVFDVELVQIMP